MVENCLILVQITFSTERVWVSIHYSSEYKPLSLKGSEKNINYRKKMDFIGG